MNTIRFWEEFAANIFPAFNHLLYDGWLLRFTDGRASHNNSVWPLYAGELPLAEKITFCEQQFTQRGFDRVFRLAEIPGHDALAALLKERGYVEENPNLMLINSSVDGPDAAITELALDDWLETAFEIDPVDDPELKPWQRRVFSRSVLPQHFVVVMHDGQACAYGYSVQQGDILNLNDLWVRPDLRSQGIGTQLIHGLMQRGKADGAQIACLAVNESNTGARRLYARLGFAQRYRYSYWEWAG
ncbi:MAG: GNAT family N-acetyltransferase [Caldilineaceae bacterium]|nr:GNAT family N-acetyltransferase [Caldilineaceae bacterium]